MKNIYIKYEQVMSLMSALLMSLIKIFSPHNDLIVHEVKMSTLQFRLSNNTMLIIFILVRSRAGLVPDSLL